MINWRSTIRRLSAHTEFAIKTANRKVEEKTRHEICYFP